MNKTMKITELERELDQLHREYDNMRARVAERDATIARLAHDLDEAMSQRDSALGLVVQAEAFANTPEPSERIGEWMTTHYDGVAMSCIEIGDVITPISDHEDQLLVEYVEHVHEILDGPTVVMVSGSYSGTFVQNISYDSAHFICWRKFPGEKLQDAS